MNKYCFFYFILCMTFMLSPASANQQLVLVAADESTMAVLSKVDLRRIFMNMPLTQQKKKITPLRNLTDDLLYQVFLQKVVFLSARTYERQLLSRVIKFGGKRQLEFEDLQQLVKVLKKNPNAVTYMWQSTASKITGIKVLETLWQGSPN